jgi:hypothetical protein
LRRAFTIRCRAIWVLPEKADETRATAKSKRVRWDREAYDPSRELMGYGP